MRPYIITARFESGGKVVRSVEVREKLNESRSRKDISR